MAASADAVPSARACPLVASVGDLTYLWGGGGDTEPESVFIYHHDTETWTRRLTSGPHPPADLSNGGCGCAMSGHNLYLYRGYDQYQSNCEDLYELNTRTWQWRIVNDGRGPGNMSCCRMTSYQDQLMIVGGHYDGIPSLRQAGAKYESGRYVRTTEVYSYCLTSGKCHCVGIY